MSHGSQQKPIPLIPSILCGSIAGSVAEVLQLITLDIHYSTRYSQSQTTNTRSKKSGIRSQFRT